MPRGASQGRCCMAAAYWIVEFKVFSPERAISGFLDASEWRQGFLPVSQKNASNRVSARRRVNSGENPHPRALRIEICCATGPASAAKFAVRRQTSGQRRAYTPLPFDTRRFSCQRTAPAGRRSLGTQPLHLQCALQDAEFQDGAVEVLSKIRVNPLAETNFAVALFPVGRYQVIVRSCERSFVRGRGNIASRSVAMSNLVPLTRDSSQEGI